MNKINQYQSLYQKMIYSKAYRAPMWILKKIAFRNIKDSDEIIVNMRIGHKIKLKPTQQYLKAVIFSGQYHDQSVFLAGQFLKPNSVILDIGANIGLYACAYAKYFSKLHPKIYAVEAVGNNYKLLNQNIELNNSKNIISSHIALGKEEGEITFSFPEENFIGNVVGTNIEKGELGFNHTEKVKMITLDQYAKEQGIESCDYIKIDIEGAEYFAFQGGEEFIRKTRPVIQAEFNKRWSNNVGVSLIDYFTFFREKNYLCAIEQGDQYIVFDEDLKHLEERDLMDILFIPKEKSHQKS